MFLIRQFEPTDAEYAAIAAIQAQLWPDERLFPPERWRSEDAEWPKEHLHQRFVAVSDGGTIVGHGACYEAFWQNQPGTYSFDFSARPDREGSGVDTQLYDTIMAVLQQRPDLELCETRMREDHTARIDFLLANGFVPAMRSPTSAIDVAAFDPGPYPYLEPRLLSEGIILQTLAEFQRQAPNWKEQLYELRWALLQDVPSIDPPIKPSMEEFEQQILDDPALAPEAWFLAIDTTHANPNSIGALVGMSNLWINDPTFQRLDAGLTGVVRSHRRRGIATALKVRTIVFGQLHGAKRIATSNEEDNPMFQLNLQLGFQPKPAWVTYRKRSMPST